MEKTLLPHVHSLEQYRALYAVDAAWLPAVCHIAARHGLPGQPVRQPLGTHVVFSLGETIVKLFCPLWPFDFPSERIALAGVRELPVPQILAEGKLEGWPYLVVSRVAGVPAIDVWPTLSGGDRSHVVQQMGALMRRLHDRPLPAGLPGEWSTFVAERIAGAEAHHDAPEPWRSWIRRRLARFVEPPLPHVLLNGDLTGDHVLLVQEDGAWQIGGIIDFGDARIGHPFYEFIAPLAFYTFGRPALTRALVAAYGLEPSPAVRDALTSYCLLHEFGRLADFWSQHTADTPAEFEAALWG